MPNAGQSEQQHVPASPAVETEPMIAGDSGDERRTRRRRRRRRRRRGRGLKREGRDEEDEEEPVLKNEQSAAAILNFFLWQAWASSGHGLLP